MIPTLKTTRSDTEEIETSAVATYAALRDLFLELSRADDPNEIARGMALGLAMFLDDDEAAVGPGIGPFRTQRLMSEAPGIVLARDARVTPRMIRRVRAALARRST